MRRGPEVSGWAGSLFPEPIAPKPHESDGGVDHRFVCVPGCKERVGFVCEHWDQDRFKCSVRYAKALSHDITIVDNVVMVDSVICDDNFVPLTQPAPKLESPWACDCRNCGEYHGGTCPLYGCMCKPHCRQEPPCAVERCVGYWPASDKFDKLAEDRLIMYLQRVSMPTAKEIAPLFPKELLAQVYNKGLIQGSDDGYRYDLGESTEEFFWRINNTPWTLAAVAKQNERNDIGVYEPFEQWKLLMRYRQKAPVAPVEPTKPAKAKKQPKLTSTVYNGNALPGSNADICSHCDCETCGLNQAHLDYTDKTWKDCPPCGCDQCLGKPELQPTTLCGRKAALTAEVMGNTESQLLREQLHVDTVQRYVRPTECADGSCTACQCQTCGYRNLNCALNGDEPVLICSTCWLNHPHHWKVYAAIVKKCPHWRDAATFPADILAPGMGPCPEIACQLMYNGEGGPCLCHSCKHGTPDCDSTCGVPGYPMETGQYACRWYAKKDVAAIEAVMLLAAELDVPDLVKVGDLVTRLHTRGFVYDIRKVTRVERTDAGWQIYGDLWDDFRHPRRRLTSKDELLVDWGVAGWRAEGGKVVVQVDNAVEKNHYDSVYGEKFADDRVIVLTEEQVEQLCATEEAENAAGPTWFTHVWLKPAGSKGHKDAQGYLEDPRNEWPHLGYARFVDTSTAKYLPGHRAESYGDEPECEHCLCETCLHQKDCRLDNTLNPCSRCKAKGARHQRAVDCEGYRKA
jgi:hypothetical protein